MANIEEAVFIKEMLHGYKSGNGRGMVGVRGERHGKTTGNFITICADTFPGELGEMLPADVLAVLIKKWSVLFIQKSAKIPFRSVLC